MDLHGGNIYRVKRERGEEVLDYSSNIAPFKLPNSIKEIVVENFDKLERYPDIDYIELREAIAKYNGCDIENVVVGNGATEILFLYMKSIKANKVLIVAPTFAEYERAVKLSGKEVSFFKYQEGYELDIERLIESIGENEVVVICNPNNPTGKFQSLEKLERLADFLERTGKKLFVDEAFIEFINDWRDKTSALLKRENIFILRALTKFYAMPGIRLGYGISYDMELLKEIKDKREPWSVNIIAELIGKNIIFDKEYIECVENWIEIEKRWFYKELLKIDGMIPIETETNFILIELKERKAKDIQSLMLEKGVLIRDASNFKFLTENYIRLAIKDRESNERAIKSLKEVLM